jgi:hypothetical protein
MLHSEYCVDFVFSDYSYSHVYDLCYSRHFHLDRGIDFLTDLFRFRSWRRGSVFDYAYANYDYLISIDHMEPLCWDSLLALMCSFISEDCSFDAH